MRNFFLTLILLVLATSSVLAAAVDNSKSLRVGLIAFENDTLFDDSHYEGVRTTLEKAVKSYYFINGEFEVVVENQRSYIDSVDRQGEVYIISYLKEHNLDLMLLSEMSTDGQQLVFKCYQKSGIYDDFYLPYSAGLDKYLPEVSVGTFLGLIERLDGRLFDNRRY